MVKQYWLKREGKTTGPFSGQQLRQMAGADIISTADMISVDKINWQVAGQVKGLFQTEQTAQGSKADSSEPSVFAEDDWIDSVDSQVTPPQQNPGTQSAKSGIPPKSQQTAGSPTTAAVRSRPPSVPASIPRRVRRTYTCPHCTRRFEAVKAGVVGRGTSTPRFKIGFFTGAESTQCPGCQAKLTFPMLMWRLYLYTIISLVSLTSLAFDVARGARIDFLRPIIVGIISFAAIRDIAMRRRWWSWLIGLGGVIVVFVLAFPLIPERWYVPTEILENRDAIQELTERTGELAARIESAEAKPTLNLRAVLGLPPVKPGTWKPLFPRPWDNDQDEMARTAEAIRDYEKTLADDPSDIEPFLMLLKMLPDGQRQSLAKHYKDLGNVAEKFPNMAGRLLLESDLLGANNTKALRTLIDLHKAIRPGDANIAVFEKKLAELRNRN